MQTPEEKKFNDQRSGFRVLLITPPQGLWRDAVEKPWNSTQPLGLAYIGASLRAAGYPVEIMDAYSLGLSPLAIRERIKSFSPDIVGISALTPQWPDAEILAGIVKDINQEILTVVGGPHVTALPAEAASRPGVDVAVVGEGEDILVALCGAVVSGGDLLGVPGLFLDRDGDIRSSGSAPAITDLDRLPFPTHDLLPEPSFYNPFPSWGRKGHFSCIISGRGCPYECTFCDVTAQQGKRYRLRSAENIVDEIS